ncbi:MAG: hypothetical protein ACI8Z1_001537 [Candidatus Azotimanducaceae bacterium]|jgi:hypothetical protein
MALGSLLLRTIPVMESMTLLENNGKNEKVDERADSVTSENSVGEFPLATLVENQIRHEQRQ